MCDAQRAMYEDADGSRAEETASMGDGENVEGGGGAAAAGSTGRSATSASSTLGGIAAAFDQAEQEVERLVDELVVDRAVTFSGRGGTREVFGFTRGATRGFWTGSWAPDAGAPTLGHPRWGDDFRRLPRAR